MDVPSKALRAGDVILIALNLVVGAVVLVILFNRNGPGRQWIREQINASKVRQVVRNEWPTIANAKSRLDLGNGTVSIVEFSDYQCPYCRRMQRTIDSALAISPTTGISYRHFPLPSHPLAKPAALAAICAEAQGSFTKMNSFLMSNDDWQRTADWQGAAAAAGITDTAKLRECMASDEAASRLQEDIALGNRLGLNSTPSFVTQRTVQAGSMAMADFMDLLK